MSLLAVLFLAAGLRVESVVLTTADARLAIRVETSGPPGTVAVHREGDVARVSLMATTLGGRFAGGRRFTWTRAEGFDSALPTSFPAPQTIDLEGTLSEVSVVLRVPAEVAVDVRREASSVLLVFRGAPPETPTHAARAPAPRIGRLAPPPAARRVEAVVPEAAAPAAAVAAPRPPTPPAETPAPPTPRAPAVDTMVAEAPPPSAPPVTPESPPAAPSSDTIELAKRLFPPAGEPPQQTGASTAELYAQLFPSGPPEAQKPERAEVSEPGARGAGLPIGPFLVQAGIRASYVNADTFLESSGDPVRDSYFVVTPRLQAEAPVRDGRFTLGYEPRLRGFGSYHEVNSNSHLLSAGLDLPLGPRTRIRLTDAFTSGVLETREADPGGEYFFGLGRFHRNDLGAGASIEVGPRLSLELGGNVGSVRFREEATFFDYGTRRASAGLGFELTPSLRAAALYAHEEVPRPDDRPEAEASAHAAELVLSGDILPLLSGRLGVAWRVQDAPGAAEGGRRFSGLTFQGSLTRDLSPDASLSLRLSRTTPVSAFEQNAYYVYTSVQGTLRLPLPLQAALDTGLGYQWNDYRTVASEIGMPREDRILAWFVGLRRPLWRHLYLGAFYRHEDRLSNVDRFDTEAEGFVLELHWDLFGLTPLR